MEKVLICAVMALYAVYLDIKASILFDTSGSIRDFQVLPMMIWAGVVSILTVIYIVFVFRKEWHTETKAQRKRR